MDRAHGVSPGLAGLILADIAANPGNAKSKFVLTLFRLAHAARGDRPRPRLLSVPVGILYRVTTDWVLGVELPWKTRVGPGLTLDHGVGLVVNDSTVIGSGVRLRHGVTVGQRSAGGESPVLEDGVDVGSGAQILGPVRVGRHARIGAGAIVLVDVPAGATAVGNPARVIEPGER